MPKFTDYELGILYGDGIKIKENVFLFTVVHDELSNIMRKAFERNKIQYRYKTVRYDHKEELENYNELHHYTIKIDTTKLEYDLQQKMENITPQFLLGYIETKGSLFSYIENKKNVSSTRHKLALSGSQKDLEMIKSYLVSIGCKNEVNIIQRKERTELGVISKSFRYNIQNREDLERIINIIDINEGTTYIKWRIESFKSFNKTTPKRIVNKAFKSKKQACIYMARELNYSIVMGEKRLSGGYKEVNILDENNDLLFKNVGWESIYNYLHKEFSNTFKVGIPVLAEKD